MYTEWTTIGWQGDCKSLGNISDNTHSTGITISVTSSKSVTFTQILYTTQYFPSSKYLMRYTLKCIYALQ
jgi:hypothetical protein